MKKIIDRIAFILVLIGGLNWGIYGLFGFDLVGAIVGGMTNPFARVIYGLVGLSALWMIFFALMKKK